jgi:hypothetical protein
MPPRGRMEQPRAAVNVDNPAAGYMKTILGANWLTTVLGIGEKGFYAVAGFILLYPDLLRSLIPPADDKYFAAGVAFLGFIIGGTKDYQTKDKNVTGGTVQNDPPALTPNSPGVQKTALIVGFLALGVSLGLYGCTGTQVVAAKQTASKVGGEIKADAQSPAGQEIIQTVLEGATNTGLAVASGNDIGAGVNAVTAAANVFEEYSGLPDKFGNPTAIADAASAAAVLNTGIPTIASAITSGDKAAKAPALGDLLNWAVRAAQDRGVSVKTSTLLQAVGSGLFSAVNKVQEAP